MVVVVGSCCFYSWGWGVFQNCQMILQVICCRILSEAINLDSCFWWPWGMCFQFVFQSDSSGLIVEKELSQSGKSWKWRLVRLLLWD